jgi:hypothetical protein
VYGAFSLHFDVGQHEAVAAAVTTRRRGATQHEWDGDIHPNSQSTYVVTYSKQISSRPSLRVTETVFAHFALTHPSLIVILFPAGGRLEHSAELVVVEKGDGLATSCQAAAQARGER